MSEGFAGYVADALTAYIADQEVASSDFILRVDGDEIAYVDVEACAVFLITVKEARFVPADARPQDASSSAGGSS